VTSRRVGESLAACGDCGSGEGLSGSVVLVAAEELAGSAVLGAGEAVVGSAAMVFGKGLSGSAASAACAKARLGTHKLPAHRITIMKDCLNTDFIE
ncbi:MAG TPA: hypothetical protein VFB76_13695, partial [Candidatus Angelobacter sp.]|nr:hypothetical protein [Candidatus Angelobacter sp.]